MFIETPLNHSSNPNRCCRDVVDAQWFEWPNNVLQAQKGVIFRVEQCLLHLLSFQGHLLDLS